MGKPTEGKWEYRPGEPGFMGNMEEPPEESYPPTVVATTHSGAEVELCQLVEPYDPDEVDVDPEAGPTLLGDETSNGHLFAASKELRRHLEATITSFWGEMPEEERHSFRRLYTDHPLMQAEAFLQELNRRLF